MNVPEARRTGRERLRDKPTAQLDADLLLAHVLGTTRENLIVSDDDLTQERLDTFTALVERRWAGIPVAYLTGTRSWFGLNLIVNDHVLIPRPETELLAEAAIHWAHQRQAKLILDVGTGSGALAIALATSLTECLLIATDVSSKALEVAAANVDAFTVADRIELISCDLIDGVPDEPDLIVANLPYIPETDKPEVTAEVLAEPHLALFAGLDGLDLIRRLLDQIAARRWSSIIILEIDPRQVPEVRSIASRLFPGTAIRILQDLSGRDRVIVIEPAP